MSIATHYNATLVIVQKECSPRLGGDNLHAHYFW
jgi:hypothetical protein